MQDPLAPEKSGRFPEDVEPCLSPAQASTLDFEIFFLVILTCKVEGNQMWLAYEGSPHLAVIFFPA